MFIFHHGGTEARGNHFHNQRRSYRRDAEAAEKPFREIQNQDPSTTLRSARDDNQGFLGSRYSARVTRNSPRYFRVAEGKIFVDIKSQVPQYLEHDAR